MGGVTHLGRRLAGVIVVVGLGACGDDGADQGMPSTEPRGAQDASGTQDSAGTTVPAPITTTTTPASPVLVDGMPQVTASPASGPVGSRIRIQGDGFTGDSWKTTSAVLWLSGATGGCSFYAEARHTVSVDAAGHLSGDFAVPATGGCRMSDDTGEKAVVPGRYTIVFQCTACSVGTFEVTA